MATRVRIYYFILIISLLGLQSLKAEAQYLSESALFQRCYLQLTSSRVKLNDPLLLDVQTAKKTAINACLEVLIKAQFASNGQISNVNDVVAKNVLTTFQRLHYSWFYSKDFPVLSFPGHNMDTKDLYDTSTPALYFTQALFKPNTPASNVITSTDNLIPIRSDMDPVASAATGHSKADFVFQNSFVFAAMGDLLGITASNSRIINFSVDDSHGANLTSFDLHKTLGGGFLGTPAYTLLNLMNFNSGTVYKTDGGLNMLRRWGKAVYHDLLCRDLPVVREEDVKSLVVPTSSIPFRTSASCTKCHASHDRISGVIRGTNILYIGLGDPSGYGQVKRGGNFAKFHPVTKPAETTWTSEPDPDYYQRPTNGVLYFRDYNGNLLDQNVANVGELGQKISATEDFYICAAKRYYAYFIGVQVDTGDIGDPDHLPLAPQALKHRDTVIKLGKNLKQHQSLRQLISEILKLDQYRKIDFGVKDGINVQ